MNEKPKPIEPGTKFEITVEQLNGVLTICAELLPAKYWKMMHMLSTLPQIQPAPEAKEPKKNGKPDN